MKSLRVLGVVVVVSAIGAAAFAGCGSSDDGGFIFGPDGGDTPDGTTVGDSALFGDVQIGDSGTHGCVNLQCYQDPCVGEEIRTTVTGKVYDPAGVNPLYNAIVYVPNAPLAPVAEGLTCDTCGVLASGAPIAVAVTDATGSFTLENVPANIDFPLVIQLGKWRRQVTLPKVTSCQSTAVTDVQLTRLPRNQSEGHIPQMVIATGGSDPFECLLRKIGIDDAEFTLPTDKGRIHVYRAIGGATLPLPDGGLDNPDLTQDAAAPGETPFSQSLWDDATKLQSYDIVMLPCEGGPHAENKSAGARKNVLDYVNAGGRAFVTHYAYEWLENGASPLPTVANWEHNESDRSDKAGANPTLTADIDTTFPKGKAFADWLTNVGAADAGYSKLPIAEWRHDVESVNKPPSQMWMHGDTRTAWPSGQAPSGARDVTQHFTFNTPIEAGVDDAGEPLQCGKVVFSDFHVSAAERIQQQSFPASCKSDPMTPQEKALEFMLFDLSACIQKEDEPTPVPPIR